jgi:hypothetical protein
MVELNRSNGWRERRNASFDRVKFLETKAYATGHESRRRSGQDQQIIARRTIGLSAQDYRRLSDMDYIKGAGEGRGRKGIVHPHSCRG